MKRYVRNKIFLWIFGFICGLIILTITTEKCRRSISVFREVNRSQSNSSQKNFAVNKTGMLLGKEILEDTKNQLITSNQSEKVLIYDWMSCTDVKDLLAKTESKSSSQFRRENAEGNRAIYFTHMQNQIGHTKRVVIKHATFKDKDSESEVYRYRSAEREIENLKKLNGLKWKGIPQLYGSCVRPHEITYVVSEVVGKPLCSGTGVDYDCFSAKDLMIYFQKTPKPGYTVLKWLSKVTCFFKQFEEHQVFMEDISGINFYYSPQTLDIFAVDLDSLLFYGDVRINSRSTCSIDRDCPDPSGNLWRYLALNHRIYFLCKDGRGLCRNNVCRGYDTSLLTCGIGHWIIEPFRNMSPGVVLKEYTRIINCMLQEYPENRCSLADSCEEATKIFEKYIRLTDLS